eukprot:XP_001692497.1 inositol polyphosphate phosphatase-like protein [Chlamydomonas reinhardtii]
MKKLFGQVARKAVALADDIASYNDGRHVPAKGTRPGGAPKGGDGGAGDGGLDPVLEHLLRNVRSRHVRQHFARTPATEYTRHRNLTIQVATYNVGGKKPHPGIRLDDWLGPGAAGAGAGARVSWCRLTPAASWEVGGRWRQAWAAPAGPWLNGQAAQRYGTLGPAAPGTAAAAAAAAAMLDAKWQGGPPPRSQLEGGGGGGGAGGGGAEGGSGVEDSTYVQVASKQLVGVYLSVWVRRSLLSAVHGVQVTTVATGFGGYLGNKGAVAARLRLFDSSLVFVAAHLTAGEAEGDELKRNADVADILRRAAFASGLDGGGAVPMTASAAAAVSASLGPGHWPAWPCGITDHDLAIWLDALINVDQLHRERTAGRVFKGWHEGRITFAPTYKYKVGTNTYNGDDAPSASASSAALAPQPASQSQADLAVAEDADSASVTGPSAVVGPDAESHKRRTPAWCDRVLWWTRAGAHDQAAAAGSSGTAAATLKQLGYWRGELAFSDHRPVSSLFSAQVVSYDRPKIESLLEAALRAVDLMQQSMRPKVTVEPVVLEAGDWVAPGRHDSGDKFISIGGRYRRSFLGMPLAALLAPGRAAAAAPPVSPGDAAALLRRHCDAASRGVLAALLPVLRSALAPAAVAANGLSAARLAGALSAWWLPPLAAGASPDAGANRRRLLRMLLEPAAAGESLV